MEDTISARVTALAATEWGRMRCLRRKVRNHCGLMPDGSDAAVSVAREDPIGLLSVVAPVFNEEQTVAELHRRLHDTLAGLDFELVLVDDGSRDDTPRILARLAAEDPRLRVVALSRNFGHQAALTAGLDHARGDVVVMMDGDLQDPPEVIPEMLERWRQGSDVVYAVRRTRAGERRLKLLAAKWFYRLFSKLAQVDLEQNAGDFRLLDRRALDVVNSLRERNRFLRGMTVWVGFTQTAVHYDRDPRFAGEPKYTLGRLIRLALDGISSFSYRPLQMATVLGFLFSAVAFLAIPVAIGFKLAGQFVPGITTVLLVVLMLGGIQLITVGIIGAYLGRVYEEVKRRPVYVVRERLNMGASQDADEALQGERTADR
jgi:polyisoprenyl-phosphate glycosyltransferase